MFVSSYSTYIDTSSSKRVSNERRDVEKKPTDSFSSKLLQTTPKNVNLGKNFPINYISNYKSLHNHQQLDKQNLDQNPTALKFTKLSTLKSAQAAYSDNSKMFSLIQKPKLSLNYTPSADKKLPLKVQEKQEEFMKTAMVNTYISNDKYYQITAA